MLVKLSSNIDRCWYQCPYFISSVDGLECIHPYWDDQPTYSNLLNREEIMNNPFPTVCPLLKEKRNQ